MSFLGKVWDVTKKGAGAVAGYYTGGLIGGAAGAGLGGGGGGGNPNNVTPMGVGSNRYGQQKQLELGDATRAITQNKELAFDLRDQVAAYGKQADDFRGQQQAYNNQLSGDIGELGNDKWRLLAAAKERGPSQAQASYNTSRDDAYRQAMSMAANQSPSGSALANRQAMQAYGSGQAQAAQQLAAGRIAEENAYRQQQIAAAQAASGITAQQAQFRAGQTGLAAQQFNQAQGLGLATQAMWQKNIDSSVNADLARQGYLTQGAIADQQAGLEHRSQDFQLIGALLNAGGSAAQSAGSIYGA